MMTAEMRYSVTDTDHQRITEAIRKVEKNTSGEVFAVVAKQSDDYFYVAGFFAALWSLVLGLVISLLGPWLYVYVPATTLVIAQLASFGLSLLLFHWFPELRMFFVPRKIAYKRASNNAVRQFLAHGIHATSGRSGVLLFVSLAERYAEVVADAGINEKVDQSQWDGMVATLTSHAAKNQIADGFIEAIEMAGALLAEHFPPNSGDDNELDDRLIEI